MVKEVPPAETSPREFASTPPRDLHSTSDIRFVITEVTKLSTLVERLITDVEAQGDKVDKLRTQANLIKGGLAVGAFALTAFGWFMNKLVDGKLQKVLEALSSMQP